MPRSQGTSRKGKPGKHDRAAGMGKALQKSHNHNSYNNNNNSTIGSHPTNKHRPRPNGKSGSLGGMAMHPGVVSIGVDATTTNNKNGPNKARSSTTQSVLEVDDLQDFLHRADLAGREFTSEREGLVVLDQTTRVYNNNHNNSTSTTPKVRFTFDQQQPQHVHDHETKHANNEKRTKDIFVFQELSVPRRPAWDNQTTKSQLERNENRSFLEWRRAIANKEEQLLVSAESHHTTDQHDFSTPAATDGGSTTTTSSSSRAFVTPFEKNLDVWRQLWRVLERSNCVLQLVDARNPLFYLSSDLRKYATAELRKPMMVLINKSDYLTARQRHAWHEYLKHQGWEDVVFFSAALEQDKLDAAVSLQRQREKEELNDEVLNAGSAMNETDNDEEEGDDDNNEEKDSRPVQHNGQNSSITLDGVDVLLTREQLLERMMGFARKHSCQPDPRFDNRIQFGMVGFPNVGKSSVINVLMGSSKHTHGMVRVGVASQPGKTKHFQTLIISDKMMLCDCPGLVFPSFVSNTADLIAAGVYPIAQMRDHWPVLTLIGQRIPRAIINALYGIQLPAPTEQELRERGLSQVPPPTAEEFLTTYCVARSMLAASSGVPDYQRAARLIIKDYAMGKLLYCHAPPDAVDTDEFMNETIGTALNNTQKLKKKLQKEEVARKPSDLQQNTKENPAALIDNDLLELIGASAPHDPKMTKAASKPGKSNKKGKTPKQKWGKKDRKNRNKDPYGCHSNPDESLYGVSSAGGIVVNAGKYSSAGYTRPASFPVQR